MPSNLTAWLITHRRSHHNYPRCKSGMMRIIIRITIIAWDLCRAVDLECYIASTVLSSLDQDVLCLFFLCHAFNYGLTRCRAMIMIVAQDYILKS